MTRVLVVEDEESYREALAYMLRKEGFDVIEAPDGAVLLLVDGPKGELLRLTPRAAGSTDRAGGR